jgi:hypothetical protein
MNNWWRCVFVIWGETVESADMSRTDQTPFISESRRLQLPGALRHGVSYIGPEVIECRAKKNPGWRQNMTLLRQNSRKRSEICVEGREHPRRPSTTDLSGFVTRLA